MEPKANGEKNQRWWEFYGIRYAMGTVIGGVIAYKLLASNTLLHPLLGLSKKGDLTFEQLLILAACGLTYCYISSAPILVFHATRFLMVKSRFFNHIVRKLFKFLVVFAVANFLDLFLILNYPSPPSLSDSYYKIAAYAALIMWCAPVMALIFSQSILIARAIDNSKYIFEKYNSLAIKRSIETTDIVESYRHLREHGNSFMIIVMEVLLGVFLHLTEKLIHSSHFLPLKSIHVADRLTILMYMLILSAWAMPAAMVWLLGLKIESEFIDFGEIDKNS